MSKQERDYVDDLSCLTIEHGSRVWTVEAVLDEARRVMEANDD